MTYRVRGPAVAGLVLTAAAGLAAGGCASSTAPGTASCSAHHAAAGQASGAPGASPGPAAAPAWTLPGGNLRNTRDVASAITSSNVSALGVAWCVPVESTGTSRAAGLADSYTTPPATTGVVA